MGIVVSVIRTVWPFFKEVVLGNKLLSYFFKRYRWVIIDLVCTFVLFLLFVNQYMVNVDIRQRHSIAETSTGLKIMELSSINSRQVDKIIRLDEKLVELTAFNKELSLKLIQPPIPKRIKQKQQVDQVGENLVKRINLLGKHKGY
jgi:hypothetical protein